MFRKWKIIIFFIFTPVLLVACGQTTNPVGTSRVEQKNQTSVQPIKFGKHVDIYIPEGGPSDRHAVLYIPAGFLNAKTPPPIIFPLVLAFHAYGEAVSNFETLTGLDGLANTEDFIVAYPEGLPDPKTNKPQWDTEPGSTDVKFIRDLVAAIEGGGYNVDPTRIYATGFSNGGGMVNRVGCDLADIVAAIAPVEGGYAEPGWAICNPARPIPVMAFHGLSDVVVPYNGGVGTAVTNNIDFPDIPDWAAAWAFRDLCDANPVLSSPYSSVTETKYTCSGNISVILFSIDETGHRWPEPSVINATSVMWGFFQLYKLP
jgi:polyhydroxybutyrate depolymerase